MVLLWDGAVIIVKYTADLAKTFLIVTSSWIFSGRATTGWSRASRFQELLVL